MKEKQEEISKSILEYLEKHPDASDTLEGIIMWWLEFERIDRSVDEIAEILDKMAEKGEIEKFHLDASNKIIFRAKRKD